MISTSDTKCIIPAIEAAHDLSPNPFSLMQLKDINFQTNYLLNYAGTDCTNKQPEVQQVFSEIGFCKYIFRKSFVNQQPVGWPVDSNSNYVTEEEWDTINKGKHLVDYSKIFRLYDPLTQSPPGEMQLQDVKVVPDDGRDGNFRYANFNIMTRAFPRTGNSSAAWGRKLMDIFVHKDYVFLVLDTGDDLIKTIRDLQLYTNARDHTGITPQTIGDTNTGARLQSLDSDKNYDDIPNIYQIHSPITLADSGCKGKPDSKNYETRNSKGVRLFSYFDLNNFDLRSGTNDPAFPTSFNVNTRLNTVKLGWNVQQNWSFPNGAAQVITKDNPHKENNNRNVKEEIKNAQSNVNIAFAATRKRSGDQGAISYAKKFPEIVTNRPEQIIYVRGPQEGNFGRNDLSVDQSNQAADDWAQTAAAAVGQGGNDEEILSQKKQWYKERTYFLTGDWPAWEWSTMNKTNAIIIYRANGFKYAIRSSCI